MTDDHLPDKAPILGACCEQLRSLVLDAARRGLSFHDFEQALWQQLLRLGHAATGQFLQQQAPGDLGPALTLPDGQQLRRLDQLHERELTCVFGTFQVSRACYGSREGQKIGFVPLDNRLQLPAGKFSYLLQDFNGLLGTDQPFARVAAALERILNLKQHVDSLERQGQHLAEHVEPFRQAQPPPPAAEEGTVLVQSIDAKGVPMRRPADAPAIHSHDHKRGPKTGRKKQAIVGAVYSAAPWVRTPEQVTAMLFRDPQADQPKEKRPEPCHKRVMARLNAYTDAQGVAHDGMAEVCAWQAEQVQGRNPRAAKAVVNLTDGDERFPKEQAKHAGGGPAVNILDLLHVTPKLWDAAALFARRDSPEAEGQVRTWVRKVLRGQVRAVVRDLKGQGAGHGLKGHQKEALTLVCNYLWKNRGRMRYHEYLRAGYPIASGVIEGACRHYVQDRMGRTGMSWKPPGAQAMLELRSVALNGTWDEFQAFYRHQECEALYPHRHLLEEVSWPLAA